MTIGDFRYLFAVRKSYEFSYNGKTYDIRAEKDASGEYITFGRVFDSPTRYRDLGTLLNTAKVENHFFREVLETL